MTPRRASKRANAQNLIPAQGSFVRSLRFRPSQIHAMGLALVDSERDEALKRMSAAGKGAKVSHPSRALDRIADHFGISGRQLEKIGDICRAAEADPDRFAHLLEEMDRTGKVNGPHTKLGRLRNELHVSTLVPAGGRYRTIVMDVPWQEDNISESCGHQYATMPFAQILALRDQVEEWAAEESCHLYFWLTNNTVRLACEAVQYYGFEIKSFHTWYKSRWGRGRYARNNTEHILFAIRGDEGCKSAFMSTPTCHPEKPPRGSKDIPWSVPPGAPESTKPDAFYDMVRALSYPPYGEAFQRTERPDFVNLYQPSAAPMAVAAE